jgi:glycosyltransferase involved in cell wall biosynthesis
VKIVVFTHLYPSCDKKDRTSAAIHNFVKFWGKSDEVIVIKPAYFSKRAAGSWLRGRFPYKKYGLDGISVYEFPMVNLAVAGTLCLLPILFFLLDRRFRPDAVVSHLYPSHRWGAKLASTLGSPSITGIHGTDVFRYNKFSARAGEAADLLVFRSDSIRRQYYAMYGQKPRRREYTAASGIDPSLITRDLSRKRTAVHAFVTAASLVPLKRVETIIEAFSLLKNRPWKYTIVGDGPERPLLEALARKRGIGEKVIFIGKVPHSEVFRYLDEALAFIMVSAPETFGLAYLEAMARGCIVVGAKGWGIDGIVEDGSNGFLCEPGDVPGIAETISAILSLDPRERRRIVDSSINTVSCYDEASVAEKYLSEIKRAAREVGK